MLKLWLIFITSFSSLAAIVGPVAQTNIYPGHISFDKKDPFYKGYSGAVKNISGLSKKTPSQIVEHYFSKNSLSDKKINELISDTKDYLLDVKKNLCIEKFDKKLTSYNQCGEIFYNSKEFQKKWKKNKYNIALKFVVQKLNELKAESHLVTKENINSKESLIRIEKLFTSLELIEAMRGDDYQRAKLSTLLRSIVQVQNVLSKDSLNKNSKHPANLLKNSNDQMFYSYQELQNLKTNGFDLSKLEPPSSGMWRKPKKSISKYDTISYDRTGIEQLKEIFQESFVNKFLDPEQVIDVQYRGDKLGGGQTVKFDAYIEDVKFKVKFTTNKHDARANFSEGSLLKKHIQASEANVEPVANTLAASIGYTIDPTYFKKKIRLYLIDKKGKSKNFKTLRLNLISSLNERYGMASNAKSALSDIRIDEEGKKYILMRSVSLEQKSNNKTDMNIGFFKRSGLGKSLKREHRAFYTFMALIMDIDLKDDNTKVKIVPFETKTGETSYKAMLSNSDMGSSLGTGHPNLYNFDLVKNQTKSRIDLNFIRIFSYDNRFSANLDDAKWLMRRVAQLKLTQIERAFSYAGHTKLVAKYYALLFAKKRNQLVKALDLLGETFMDDANESFTIELLDQFDDTIEGFEKYFVNGFLTDPNNELLDEEFENFPRYWGMSYTNFLTDDPQKQLVKDLKLMIKLRAKRIINENVISQVSLSNSGLGFLNNGTFQNNIFNFCDGNCFFSGLNVGVNSFIPYRFVIDNPDNESPNPFLIVDIFRLGLYAGNSTNSFEQNLSLAQRNLLSINSGAKVFRLKEYIKVKEVKTIDAFFDQRPSIKINAKEVFKSLDEKIINLNNNESVLIREYLGIAGEIAARPVAYIPFSSIRLRTRAVGIKSSLVDKTKDHFYLRNGKLSSLNADLTFNLIDMIFRYPIARYANTTNSFDEKVIKFNNGTKLDVIVNCLKSTKKCLENPTQKRKSSISTTETIFDFFKIFGQIRTKTRGQSLLEDFFNKTQSNEKYYIFRTNTYRLRKLVLTQGELLSVAHINDRSEINVAVELNYFRPAAKIKHFKMFLEDYARLLPDDLANYNTSQMKFYLGDLKAQIKVIINEKALAPLFDNSFLEGVFCSAFMDFKKLPINPDCTANPSKQVKVFLRKYRLAKVAYDSLKETNVQQNKHKHLKRLAKFFHDKKFKTSILKFLTRISPKQGFKRDVQIVSSLNAFAGDVGEIKESNYYKGEAQGFAIINSTLIGDRLLKSLNPFVYNNIDFDQL